MLGIQPYNLYILLLIEARDIESSSDETSEDSDSCINVSVGKPSPRREQTKCPVDCEQDIHKEILHLREKRYKDCTFLKHK